MSSNPVAARPRLTLQIKSVITTESHLVISRAINDKTMSGYLKSRLMPLGLKVESVATAPVEFVQRDGVTIPVAAIDGRTQRGGDRRRMVAVVAAALGTPFGLRDWQYNALGGMSFTDKTFENLLAAKQAREANPIVSLMGSAAPVITGRCAVGTALSRCGYGDAVTWMEAGHRINDPEVDSDFYARLSEDDRRAMASQKVAEIERSRLNAEKKTLERDMKSAAVKASTDGRKEQIQARIDEIDARLKVIAGDAENTITRPLDDFAAIMPGVVFDQTTTLRDVTHAEAGLYLASRRLFAEDPRIGGKATLGFGVISVHSEVWLKEPGTASRRIGAFIISSRDGFLVTDDADGIIASCEAAWADDAARLEDLYTFSQPSLKASAAADDAEVSDEE